MSSSRRALAREALEPHNRLSLLGSGAKALVTAAPAGPISPVSDLIPAPDLGEGAGNYVFQLGGRQMEVKHCCVGCGEVMEVHEHASYQEIKDCLTGMYALCAQCAGWPGSPSARADAGQE